MSRADEFDDEAIEASFIPSSSRGVSSHRETEIVATWTPTGGIYPTVPDHRSTIRGPGDTLSVELKPCATQRERAVRSFVLHLLLVFVVVPFANIVALTVTFGFIFLAIEIRLPVPPLSGCLVWLLAVFAVLAGLTFLMRKTDNDSNRWFQRRLTRLEVSTAFVVQGEPFLFWVRQCGSLRLVEPLTLCLVCEEAIWPQFRPRGQPETRCVFRKVLGRGNLTRIGAWRADEWEGEGEVPMDAMHSLAAHPFRVEWKLRVEGRTARGKAFLRDFVLVVLPPTAAVTLSAGADASVSGGLDAQGLPRDFGVRVQLDRKDGCYLPNERLSGTFALGLEGRLPPTTIELWFCWRLEGLFDHHAWGSHAVKRLAPDEADLSNPAREHAFAITLPNSPFSYEGAIVQLHWQVVARVHFLKGKPLVVAAPFVLGRVLSSKEIQA